MHTVEVELANCFSTSLNALQLTAAPEPMSGLLLLMGLGLTLCKRRRVLV